MRSSIFPARLVVSRVSAIELLVERLVVCVVLRGVDEIKLLPEEILVYWCIFRTWYNVADRLITAPLRAFGDPARPHIAVALPHKLLHAVRHRCFDVLG